MANDQAGCSLTIWNYENQFYMKRGFLCDEKPSGCKTQKYCTSAKFVYVCLLAIVVRPVSALELNRTRSKQDNLDQLFHVALTCCSFGFFAV